MNIQSIFLAGRLHANGKRKELEQDGEEGVKRGPMVG